MDDVRLTSGGGRLLRLYPASSLTTLGGAQSDPTSLYAFFFSPSGTSFEVLIKVLLRAR